MFHPVKKLPQKKTLAAFSSHRGPPGTVSPSGLGSQSRVLKNTLENYCCNTRRIASLPLFIMHMWYPSVGYEEINRQTKGKGKWKDSKIRLLHHSRYLRPWGECYFKVTLEKRKEQMWCRRLRQTAHLISHSQLRSTDVHFYFVFQLAVCFVHTPAFGHDVSLWLWILELLIHSC